VLSDFPTAIDNLTSHRPWPLPEGRWIMTQTWHDLLFAHWPVGVDRLRALVPPGLELDLFEGEAWLGVIPFRMTNVAPRGLPALPWMSAFQELNVRTYVRADGKPGVYFFSLDASNPVAVAIARTSFRLPYYTASMEVAAEEGGLRYRSRRTAHDGPPAVFAAQYRPVGDAFTPQPGSREYFLTERYCLYTVDDRLAVRRLEIHHPPWVLQGAEAHIAQNTMADAAGVRLPSTTPLLHFAKRQDTLAWGGRTLS
jgi:uncharacterized protein YqjF (DUF2071 family)